MLNTIMCNKQPEDKGIYKQVIKYLVIKKQLIKK